MQKIDTTLSPAHDLAKTYWDFVEVWIAPLLSPPYLLLLTGEPSGGCRVHDPADGYRLCLAVPPTMRLKLGC